MAVAAVELAAAAPAAEAFKLVVGREEQVAAAAAANPANAAEGRSAVADPPSGPPSRRLPQRRSHWRTFI